MQDKPVVLVTGANQGIGLQIAKDLVAHGFTKRRNLRPDFRERPADGGTNFRSNQRQGGGGKGGNRHFPLF